MIRLTISTLVMMMACDLSKETKEFTSRRISNSSTIKLDGSIEDVFPLFGPIREMDWEPTWKPEIIFPQNKEVEEHMVFRTIGRFEAEALYTWIISQYYPSNYLIEYTVSTLNRIWTIRITCQPEEKETLATITYTYTSLSERGSELNALALEKIYEHKLEDWREAINSYLHSTRIDSPLSNSTH